MDCAILEELGLSPNEISVYLSLLRRGDSSASAIALETKLHRTNVYDLLKKLIQKGFISHYTSHQKRFFKAMPPQQISKYFEESVHTLQRKKEQVDLLIKDLNYISFKPIEHQNVQVFSGKNGLKSFYEEMLTGISITDNYFFVGSNGKIFELLEYYFPRFIQRVLQLNIKGKLLVNKSLLSSPLFFAPSGVDIRLLPNQYTPTVTFIAVKDKVGIYYIGDQEDPFIVLLKSKHICHAYQQQFELMWSAAKPVNNTSQLKNKLRHLQPKI